MPKHYIVTINCFDRQTPYVGINDVLNQLKDWARFAPQSWIVWTDLSAIILYDRLKAVLDTNDHIWVVKADLADHKGWIPTGTVEWLSKPRQTIGE